MSDHQFQIVNSRPNKPRTKDKKQNNSKFKIYVVKEAYSS